MGVDVDEAGGHDEPVGVDDARRALGDPAHRHDPAVSDPEIGLPGGCAGPVDDGTAPDDEIEHGASSDRGHELVDVGLDHGAVEERRVRPPV